MKPQPQYLLSTECALISGLMIGDAMDLWQGCMGNADTASMCSAQIMSAEKLDFNFDGHFCLLDLSFLKGHGVKQVFGL